MKLPVIAEHMDYSIDAARQATVYNAAAIPVVTSSRRASRRRETNGNDEAPSFRFKHIAEPSIFPRRAVESRQELHTKVRIVRAELAVSHINHERASISDKCRYRRR